MTDENGILVFSISGPDFRWPATYGSRKRNLRVCEGEISSPFQFIAMSYPTRTTVPIAGKAKARFNTKEVKLISRVLNCLKAVIATECQALLYSEDTMSVKLIEQKLAESYHGIKGKSTSQVRNCIASFKCIHYHYVYTMYLTGGILSCPYRQTKIYNVV